MKSIQTALTAVALLGTLTLTSCSFFEGSAKHREVGTPIPSTKKAVDAILADDEANEGKRFMITGYLNYSASMSVYTSRPQTVYVYSSPDHVGANITPIEMHWAENGTNSVFVPQDGGGDETKTIFYDNDSKPITGKDKVNVSFSVSNQSVYPIEIRIDKAK